MFKTTQVSLAPSKSSLPIKATLQEETNKKNQTTLKRIKLTPKQSISIQVKLLKR